MTLSSQYKVSSNPKFTTLLSHISVQGQNEEQRPSRLSTRSPQSKIYDLLVSVQGQNETKNDPLVSVQGHFNPKFTTLSSQYKVKMKKKNGPLVSVQGQFESKIYNPLISIQGQFKVCDPLVLVQGLGLCLYIYFIVFYFHNRTKLVFLSLLIF